MPNRIIREGILTSDRVNELGWGAEVFYRRLISKVDDFGRYEGRLSILRSELYGLKVDEVSTEDVSGWLGECVKAGIVETYNVSDKPYLLLKRFRQQKRAKTSKWPQPPDLCVADDAQTHSGCGCVRTKSESEALSEAETEAEPNGSSPGEDRPPKTASKIRWNTSADGGWVGITDEHRQRWSDAFPACNLDRQLKAMDSWCQANPLKAKKSNWERFIVNWLTKEQDRGGDAKSNRPDSSGPSRIRPAPGKYDHIGKPA